jgi:hypothetical protein
MPDHTTQTTLIPAISAVACPVMTTSASSEPWWKYTPGSKGVQPMLSTSI